MSKSNESAFPVSKHVERQTEIGLSKRELFAAMAMQGIMAFGDPQGEIEDSALPMAMVIARGAVMCADALLVELSKTEPSNTPGETL